MTDVQETCIFCGASDLAREKQTVAGDKVSVCRVCASFGAAALEDDPSGAFVQCLHMTAIELERAASARLHWLTARQRRSLARLRSAFDRSAFMSACACPSCSRWQIETDLGLGFEGPPVHVYRVGDVEVFTDLDMGEPPLWVLRGMSPQARVAAPDGRMLAPDKVVPLRKADNIAKTALDDGTADRVRALAESVQHPTDFVTVGQVARRFALRRASQDANSLRHWRMVEKYGPGLRDGDFWLTRDGCVIPLEAADRVFPMSDADHRALEADKARAARWRGGDRVCPPLHPVVTFEDSLAGTCDCDSCRKLREERAGRS